MNQRIIKKKITIGEYNAEHLYELALQNFQKGCFSCDVIKDKLEKFLGEKTVRHIKRTVKKRPYEQKR